MSLADGFHWFVYGYGKPKQLQEYFLANFDTPIICTCITIISQGAYCWRIYRLSGQRLMTLAIALVSHDPVQLLSSKSLPNSDSMLPSRGRFWYWDSGAANLLVNTRPSSHPPLSH